LAGGPTQKYGSAAFLGAATCPRPRAGSTASKLEWTDRAVAGWSRGGGPDGLRRGETIR